MEKLIILLALILNCGISFAEDVSFGIPVDKRLHMLTSYMICDIAKDYGANKYDKFWIITGIGIAKEIYDSKAGGFFDYTDLLANYAGYFMEGTRVNYRGGKLVISTELIF